MITTNKYDDAKKIGSGTYGIVYGSGKYAIKRNLVEESLDFIGCIRDLDLLCWLSHPNIISLVHICFGSFFTNGFPKLSKKRQQMKDDRLHFIFEKANFDLAHVIDNNIVIDTMDVMRQVLLAIKYIHSCGIMHRDLSPSNILLFQKNNKKNKYIAKISDFGFAKPIVRRCNETPNVVTPSYRAPEICLKLCNYNNKIDIWSVGCIFYELETGNFLVSGSGAGNSAIFSSILRNIHESSRVLEKLLQLPNLRSPNKKIPLIRCKESIAEKLKDKLHPNLLDLIISLLKINPDERFSADQALSHRYFTEEITKISEEDFSGPQSDVAEYLSPEREGRSHLKISTNSDKSLSYVEKCSNNSQIQINLFSNKQVEENPLKNRRSDYRYLIAKKRNYIRQKIVHIIMEIWNHPPHWYNHRILFQSLDLFDRYLIKRNKMKLQFKDIYRKKNIDLHIYYIILYISLKYFSVLNSISSFSDTINSIPGDSKKILSKKTISQIEQYFITDILKYKIYRPTLYEVAQEDSNLTNNEIYELLLIFCNTDEYSGITPFELLDIYRKFSVLSE